MTANEAQTLIRYTGWASRKILDAVEQMPADERAKTNGVSHGSIEGTVNHIFLADRVWFQRATQSADPVVWQTTFDEVRTAWPELLDKWQALVDGMTDEDVARMVPYKLLNGNPGESQMSHIITHVVNHATLHRGQVMGMLRQLGIAPPPTDILWFYRESGAKA